MLLASKLPDVPLPFSPSQSSSPEYLNLVMTATTSHPRITTLRGPPRVNLGIVGRCRCSRTLYRRRRIRLSPTTTPHIEAVPLPPFFFRPSPSFPGLFGCPLRSCFFSVFYTFSFSFTVISTIHSARRRHRVHSTTPRRPQSHPGRPPRPPTSQTLKAAPTERGTGSTLPM